MPAKLKKVMALTFRVGHIRYLQEKDCPLLVQGQFNPEVVRLYRTLQKNTPGLAPKYLDLLEKATTISTANVRSQNVWGRGTGYSGRPDYYRACGGERDFFPSSGFYRDKHNNSISNAQSGANLRPTQDRSSAYTCMYA